MEFSKDIQEILKTKFNNIDIYSLNKQELELLKTQIIKVVQTDTFGEIFIEKQNGEV